MIVMSPDQEEGLRSGIIARMLRLDHPDGVIRMSSLPVDWVDAGGATWVGGYRVIQIGDTVSKLGAEGATLSITWNGASEELRSLAMDGKVVKARLRHYLCILNGSPLAQKGGMLQTFDGSCEVPAVDNDTEKPTITVNVESKMLRLRRPRPFRYTLQDHRVYFPTDTFFKLVPELQDVRIDF